MHGSGSVVEISMARIRRLGVEANPQLRSTPRFRELDVDIAKFDPLLERFGARLRPQTRDNGVLTNSTGLVTGLSQG